MALGTPTELAAAGATASSVTTASFTPTANATLVAFACNRNSGASIPTISDSLGGTWNPFNAGHDGTAVGARAFWQEIGASPASMTVTVQDGGGAQHAVHVLEITGADPDTSNVQSTLDANGDPALTMSAYAANSLCLGYCLVTAGAAMTGPTDFTELYDQAPATNTRIHVSYDMVSPTTSLAWAGNNNESIAYGIEIKELAAGSPQDITGGLFTDGDTFHAGSLSLGIIGALFTDTDTFPTGVVTTTYSITGALFTDADTFYAGLVQLENEQNIDGSLFVDADSFHTGVVTATYNISGGLFTDSDTFHSGTLTTAAFINGNLFIDPDTFYTGEITGGESGSPVGMLSFVLLRKRRKAGE